MTFSEVFEEMKKGSEAYIRMHDKWFIVGAHFPIIGTGGKITGPYLYRRYPGIVTPWIPDFQALFSNEWVLTPPQQPKLVWQ